MKPIYRPKFGRSQIHAEPAGFYQPVDDAGVPAVVLGVADRYGEISDLVAWLPDNPGDWWLRRGALSVLGEAEVRARSIPRRAPLPVRDTERLAIQSRQRRATGRPRV